ncbi:putative type III secretion protein SctL [Chlamydiales bacterium STE3]|nr:putative type III secretion protein SctL [Chlamydiales bacterium STE3]
MKKKFFSLIKGATIHLAPQTKILPKEEIATLLDGKGVLNAIKEDAEAFRLQVVEEAEKIKEKAQSEGYEEGFKNWAEHVAKLEEEIANVRVEMEKLIIPVALKAAKKIVGREIELSETAIVDIVSNSLKAVSTHKKITVYVNKKDLESLEKHKQQLRDIFENLEVFSIMERADIQPGGCIIETEGGIINAQLENQWRTLERAFDMLMKTKQKG